MEYKLLATKPEESVTAAVNRHLKDGWKLYGSPCVASYPTGLNSNSLVVCQAMTRDESAPKEISPVPPQKHAGPAYPMGDFKEEGLTRD